MEVQNETLVENKHLVGSKFAHTGFCRGGSGPRAISVADIDCIPFSFVSIAYQTACCDIFSARKATRARFSYCYFGSSHRYPGGDSSST
jgi:hypothetical protein